MNMDPKDPKLLTGFQEYDQRSIIPNFKLACLLGIVLMPAGFVLDYAMYPEMALAFFKVRLLCSVLIFLFLLILLTPRGQKHQRSLGVILALLPAASIAWMIYKMDGGKSPYYAGLNLVLLVVGFVLHWTFYESLIAVSLVVLMYLVACLAHGSIEIRGVFFSNVYFLGLTGIIVVVGNRFHTLLRFREFEARQELDSNRQMLEASNKKLVEMDQVKTRFFANISHELRTPLTLLIAPLEVLLNNPNLNLDPASRELLKTMRANSMRLLKLINDLLDLVKLESGNLEIKTEPIPFSEFVNGLIVSVRTVAEDKRLTLVGRVDENVGVIQADRDKLEKVLLNLLFNSIKFTPSGGTVSILVDRMDPNLLIRVKDTGMGISAENLPFVFRRFWQADTSSKRKYQGTGIGLALVKELVEAHGGTVTVESASGKGTTMSLSLPYRPAALDHTPALDDTKSGFHYPEVTPSQDEWLSSLYRRAELFPSLSALQDSMRPNEVPGARKRGIALVADDEPDMLRFLRSQLESQFQVVEAVDGAQAVEKANQYLPEIILLDMMMPEKDGLQVCRELREKTSTQSIPIILLTARADEETKIAVLKAGANDFLSKPFSTTELHVRTRNLVDSHQLQRTLTRQNQILEATLEQLKETESQLVQSEKLASLGRMSAGIIHEINNPLNYAKTGLFTLKNKGKYMPPEQLETYVDIIKDIEEGVDRVKTIVSDLRSFTHPNMESLEECDLLKLVKSALRLVSHQSQDEIQIITEITPDLAILCNGNKMIQVLVNLFQNAMDSMKVKKYQDETPLLQITAASSGAKTILKIRDNGKGISSEHQGKVFEPFFTTKDVGEGMGLGLSIVYRIIQDCEGRIEVVSEVGKYCEFRLEFPVVVQKN
ncbi:MAG: Integral rane sensor hybrid histidine kinase [Verrucomicrobiales bacterium]|nr:Integral rane sensor hybrid histidine kinase [Verrucomicrobiales bacterium]